MSKRLCDVSNPHRCTTASGPCSGTAIRYALRTRKTEMTAFIVRRCTSHRPDLDTVHSHVEWVKLKH